MNESISVLISAFLALSFLAAASCCQSGKEVSEASGPRTIKVAQSGEADVIGADDKALQKGADMLQPGDTLEIGPGTYRMENSLVVRCSSVVVRGTPGETILFKGPGVASRVIDCGDYGESVLVVEEPWKFKPGMGLSVSDDSFNRGWAVTVTSVESITGDTLHLTQMTLRDYDYENANARVENKFPILCAIEADKVTFEDIIVDGNKDENPYFIDGCRGGAIYLYIARDCVIKNCVSRNYNGDGISFQITDRIKVIDCESYGHTGFGVHPGTGSPHAEIKSCRFHDNARVGFFLCWRVREGVFSDNLIENNGLYGISIGHKDTDNLFVNNTVRNNGFCGIYFRQESAKVSGHRNVFRENVIQDNGDDERGYGVYVEPHARDMVFESNTIADTRSDSERTQRYGVYLADGSGPVEMKNNTMKGHLVKDFFDENK
ncbi:MAG TPA: right-handed parallel beta-helix repeat-containing protein [archaeon]|nr:right-handed parallel beta-helix repeat-containing protein [archaeon]